MPIKDGYYFDGWFWDNDTFSLPFTADSLFNNPILTDTTIYAKWIGSTTVSFDSRGGTTILNQHVPPGSKISIPVVSKEGFTLEGWYTSLDNGQHLDEKWSFINDAVYTDLTLYANWSINQYTISFESNGGLSVNSISNDYGSDVSAPLNPRKTGYIFRGLV